MWCTEIEAAAGATETGVLSVRCSLGAAGVGSRWWCVRASPPPARLSQSGLERATSRTYWRSPPPPPPPSVIGGTLCYSVFTFFFSHCARSMSWADNWYSLLRTRVVAHHWGELVFIYQNLLFLLLLVFFITNEKNWVQIYIARGTLSMSSSLIGVKNICYIFEKIACLFWKIYGQDFWW